MLFRSKLAATFASLGTPAIFVHATEAMHGDMGMITSEDLVILISNSGETKETLAPLPSLKRIGAATVAFTGQDDSHLAQACESVLTIPVTHEADDLGLAPTSSSTAALMVGDALACTISRLKGFTASDFALYHPGGALGQKLLKQGSLEIKYHGRGCWVTTVLGPSCSSRSAASCEDKPASCVFKAAKMACGSCWLYRVSAAVFS